MSSSNNRGSGYFDPNFFGSRAARPRQPPSAGNFWGLLSMPPDRGDEVLPLVSQVDFDSPDMAIPGPSRAPARAPSSGIPFQGQGEMQLARRRLEEARAARVRLLRDSQEGTGAMGGVARALHAARAVHMEAVGLPVRPFELERPRAARAAPAAVAERLRPPPPPRAAPVAPAAEAVRASRAAEAVRPVQDAVTPKTPRKRNASAELEETPPKRPRHSPATGVEEKKQKNADKTASKALVETDKKLKQSPQQGKQNTSRQGKSHKAQPADIPCDEHEVKLQPLEAPARKSTVGLREICLAEIPASMIRTDDKEKNASDEDDDAPRKRPQRTRMPPLDFWRNERVIYERKPGDIGFSVAGVVKNCAPHASAEEQTSSQRDLKSIVQDPNVAKFQGMNPSSGVISDGVKTNRLSTHSVVIPHWLKHQKKPPTVVLPIPSSGCGTIYVVEGSVRLACIFGSKYKEVQLHAGDICNIPDIETQFLAAATSRSPLSKTKGMAALLKVMNVFEGQ
mmetsp:Transcript_14125/g.26208  ORF Transcript_14125/g.26208 Transcript_14125/m.26208 type:complete len:509 (-) Transcript_14125:88-1614(-)